MLNLRVKEGKFHSKCHVKQNKSTDLVTFSIAIIRVLASRFGFLFLRFCSFRFLSTRTRLGFAITDNAGFFQLTFKFFITCIEAGVIIILREKEKYM